MLALVKEVVGAIPVAPRGATPLCMEEREVGARDRVYGSRIAGLMGI